MGKDKLSWDLAIAESEMPIGPPQKEGPFRGTGGRSGLKETSLVEGEGKVDGESHSGGCGVRERSQSSGRGSQPDGMTGAPTRRAMWLQDEAQDQSNGDHQGHAGTAQKCPLGPTVRAHLLAVHDESLCRTPPKSPRPKGPQGSL